MGAVYFELLFPFHGERYITLNQLLFNNNLHISIEPLKAEEHNTSEFELTAICALALQNNTKTVFEIGTFNGRTARAIALNLKQPDSAIYTLNIKPEITETILQTSSIDIGLAGKVVIGERFHGTPEEVIIHQLWGDSASFDYTPFKQKVDFVFIDGAHSEFYARNDTLQALQLIKQDGGLIIWHDAYLFGVVKFLKKWIQDTKYPIYFIKGTTLAITAIQNGIIINPIEYLQKNKIK
jgi:predicted O-methyltransferase YrrM